MNADRQIPFRWVLPLAQLVICLNLLWPLMGFIALQLQGVAHEVWPARVRQPVYFLQTTPAIAAPQPAHLGEDRDRSTSLLELRLQIPVLLNFPCTFLGLLRIAPAAMLHDFWRAISFPIVGMFFWWLVGRSVEALVASRHGSLSPVVVLAEVVVASLLIVGNGGLLVGLAVDPTFREELVFPWRLAAAAAGLWVLLSIVIVGARIVQWRLRRSATVLS
jgi:hypothetical protein